MTNFFKLIFLSTLTLGTAISISSLSWIPCWMGLEINLLSFIVTMKTPKNKFSSESISKYFMIQAMASFLLLFSIILFSVFKSFNYELNNISSALMSISLLMKMGAAPLHFWFPEVASGISWNSNMLLFTWQKIAPMILISYLNMLTNLLIIFIISSAIIGSILGLNQICLRKILAYSSINHISWMLSSLLCSLNTWLLYFSIYSIINIILIMTMSPYKIFYISQINKFYNKPMKILWSMNLFSLGGLPPFLGFLPKWITINQLSNSSFFFLTAILILFTLVALYFYLRISFSSITLHSNLSSTNFSKMNFYNSMMNIISTSSIPTMILFMNFIL